MSREVTHVETTIENGIALGNTQRSIAKIYALALKSSWPTDWKRVNAAIIRRWSIHGLKAIKEMAWKGTCWDGAGEHS